jgi:hypothetical protein
MKTVACLLFDCPLNLRTAALNFKRFCYQKVGVKLILFSVRVLGSRAQADAGVQGTDHEDSH